MKINSTIKNISSLGILQLFNYLLPIFSVPYLLLKLGPSENGYLITSQTIISYLTLIVDYGFVVTASKRVALVKKREEIEKIFSSVFYSKLILLIITLFLLFFLLILLDNNLLFYCVLIGTFQIIGVLFNPVWLFQGTENADVLAKVNIIVRTLFYLLIFVFVHSPKDIYVAAFLLTLPHFIVGLICFKKAKNFFNINLVKVSRVEILTELKEGFYGFWITAMNYTYTASGILFLGFFSNQEMVGIYGTIEKLIRSGIQIFNPIIHGLYPKVIHLISENKTKKFLKLLYMCFILSITIGIGIFILSPLISKIFLANLSNDFSIGLLQLLAIWFSLNTMNVVIGIWIFFGKNRMQIYTKIYTSTTIVCLILHLLLVPLVGTIAVPINLVIGEILMLIIFYLVLKRVRI